MLRVYVGFKESFDFTLLQMSKMHATTTREEDPEFATRGRGNLKCHDPITQVMMALATNHQ